jgi:hypothetical protein
MPTPVGRSRAVAVDLFEISRYLHGDPSALVGMTKLRKSFEIACVLKD